MCKEDRIKVGQFVDDYMHRYLALRSGGRGSDDAIKELHRLYVERAGRNWGELSLSDQIMQWGSLSFSDQMGSLDASGIEENNIVRGIRGAMPVALSMRKSSSDERIRWAMDYLVRKYNIGGAGGKK
jgi:hypothetical protein